ncbi:uncharacterized protein BDZ83DRAFT_620371 [Colletotrichum acutatum]|uniref:Uncharacterized protein n=1 Tax=Glomerella acutata TaxID=27357 RepID=A0AAD8UQ25_GLOAC|nr:uncharacterized protein BDZ83DRAFT_620371 [Colletotrichum acutatum]KAK1725291.1 hypothetical protein BDZ83DRAFT_620371 [Colletotrichum acutatum]
MDCSKPTKSQPWKRTWPPQTQDAATRGATAGVDYGAKRGEVVVVDGTSANLKPLHGPVSDKK